jgi:hypothetical protein
MDVTIAYDNYYCYPYRLFGCNSHDWHGIYELYGRVCITCHGCTPFREKKQLIAAYKMNFYCFHIKAADVPLLCFPGLRFFDINDVES